MLEEMLAQEVRPYPKVQRSSTNQLRSFQLDKKEYPVVSQNDLGAPRCVVSPKNYLDLEKILSGG